jgi:hypothetical protein
MFDVTGTIFGGVVISEFFNWDIWAVTGMLFVAGFISHRIFLEDRTPADVLLLG